MIHFVRLRTTFETLRRVQGYPRIYPPSVIFSKFINGVLRGLKTSRPRERERDTDIESYVGRQTNSLARSDQKGSLSPSLSLFVVHTPTYPRHACQHRFQVRSFSLSLIQHGSIAKMLRRVMYTLCNCKNHYIVFFIGIACRRLIEGGVFLSLFSFSSKHFGK